MKLFLSLSFIAAISILGSSCIRNLKGSGDYITQQRSLPAFEAIESNGDFNIFIVKSHIHGVSITAEDNIIDELETIVSDGKLKIRFKRAVSVKHGDITMYISMDDVESISILGSGYIKPQGTWNVDELHCTLTGSGELVGSFNARKLILELGGSGTYFLSGNAEQAEYDVTGSGNINAYAVHARDVIASVTGSGNCELSVSRKLNARISGSGKIRYKGDPTDLVQNITGSGRIEKQ